MLGRLVSCPGACTLAQYGTNKPRVMSCRATVEGSLASTAHPLGRTGLAWSMGSAGPQHGFFLYWAGPIYTPTLTSGDQDSVHSLKTRK